MIVDFKSVFDLNQVAFKVDNNLIEKIIIKSISFELINDGAYLKYNNKFSEEELLTKQELIEYLNKED